MYSSQKSVVDDNIKKWVVLNKPQEYEVEFYKSLNFSIIDADTRELLAYMKEYETSEYQGDMNIKRYKEYEMPSIYREASYPVEKFFLGDVPRWSYIHSGQIIKTQHYKKISNLIYGGGDAIVIGIPASGKTTLMMQLASNSEIEGIKHILYMPTVSKAEKYCKDIGDTKVILFIDDCLNDYDAFVKLAQKNNIQVIGFERDSRYESISYKLFESGLKFDVYDVTEVNEQDAVRIIESIPKGLSINKMKEVKDKIIFEIIRLHSKVPMTGERYLKALEEWNSSNPEIAELFVMISYVHSCGTPVSYDMIYSYLERNDYREVYDKIRELGKMVTECYGQDFSFLGGVGLDDQDYYKCRTRHLAELIIKKISIPSLMCQMLNNFIERVPVFKICRYDIFKRSAFDADLVTKYFKKYEDGICFYQKCLEIEDSAFMYQQIALYASRKKKYSDAFKWIDKAKNCERKNIFSIRNTHAIILFNANIEKENQDGSVIETLHNSLEILKDCYKNDLRKSFHARMFGELISTFYQVYGYDEVEQYLEIAIEWLNKEIASGKNGKTSTEKMRRIRGDIEKIYNNN